MEGRSSTPQAAAAALVKNTGVSEEDVVLGGGSRRGAGAPGSGLVLKAADQEEHGVGGATLPDLNVQLKAEDTLVGETSSVRKRKFEELDDSEDSAHSYISSEIESRDAVSYNSAASDASSEAEVTKYNELSYEKKLEDKIWEEGLSAYMNNEGKYFCKFHPFKQVPRNGLREGHVAHVKNVRPKDRRDKANHAALIKVLEYFGRFDRLLDVQPPDEADREDIFRIHTRSIPCSPDVDLNELARLTEGYTGADIKLVCREAAVAALDESFDIPEVGITHFKSAIDRVKPSDMKFYRELAARFSRFIDNTEKATLPKEDTEPAIS
ncbi:hypothetical protein ACQ4PT_017655 [Festuca glaucescens]